ncbi:NYN domain-containing protein [Nocardioides coralli]|uniref:NYN domain-containing protein n=1 Tax=Nocardioides coralli TaxID=2872154 RepID=UPI001CA3A1B0|nr:NYN domain-containing protein [Nocardioides coralli]QZY29772.1 NYN domain-containing protein [Nocardioides coralli]
MESDSSAVRIAVLIDADNTSPKYAEAILDELAKYGTPTIRRAYGDFTSPRMSGWSRELNTRAIRAIHQNAFTTGKNATDSALIIDAMDLLYAGNVEAFAIVSSDSDFTSLALRLQESGKTVYGLGRRRTPVSLQNACSRFIELEVLGTDGDDDDAGEDGGGDTAPQLNLQSVLTKAVNAIADDDGWASLSDVGSHLARSHPSFDPRSFGHAKLSSLVADQPFLQTRDQTGRLGVALKGSPARKSATKKAPAKRAARKTTKKA